MHNMNEWTLSSRFAYVAYIDVFSPSFQWYDVILGFIMKKNCTFTIEKDF
jgi:hypothetical protein